MRVALLGSAQTPFGVSELDTRRLASQAIVQAAVDAGVGGSDLDVAFCGYAITGLLDGQENVVGHLALRDAGMAGVPVTRVENACASSACALHEAVAAILSERADVAVAFGVEKMTGQSTSDAMRALAGAGDVPFEAEIGMTFPATFALLARRYGELYGDPREAMAAVAVKAHRNAGANPKAHLRREISPSDVYEARLVADPLTLLDCCPVSDGAAAVIVASERYVARHGLAPAAWVRATALSAGTFDDNSTLDGFAATRTAAARAYEEAGIGPQDVDVAEVHDCFTIAEIFHVEDLGFADKGKGAQITLAGETDRGGRIPVNTSGGLKAKGHPVGATGIGQICELVDQLNGRAGSRQVDDPRFGLAHCMGGFLAGDCASLAVTILERP